MIRISKDELFCYFKHEKKGRLQIPTVSIELSEGFFRASGVTPPEDLVPGHESEKPEDFVDAPLSWFVFLGKGNAVLEPPPDLDHFPARIGRKGYFAYLSREGFEANLAELKDLWLNFPDRHGALGDEESWNEVLSDAEEFFENVDRKRRGLRWRYGERFGGY